MPLSPCSTILLCTVRPQSRSRKRHGHSMGKGFHFVCLCVCGLANRKTGNHQGLHSGFACVLTKLPKRPISSGSLSGYGNGRFSECGFVEMLFLFPGLVTLFPQSNGEGASTSHKLSPSVPKNGSNSCTVCRRPLRYPETLIVVLLK